MIRNNTMGHNSFDTSDTVEPFNIIPRVIVTKCVSGKQFPIHCAQKGMPKKGKAKPESNNEGKKNKVPICVACSCVLAIVETEIPTNKFAKINGNVNISNNVRLP